MKPRIAIRVLLGIAFYVLGGWFIWRTAQGTGIGSEIARISTWRGTAVAALWVLARSFSAFAWGSLLTDQSLTRQLLLAGGVFALSTPGKYVPGKILTMLARALATHALHAPAARILTASVVEFALGITMTAIVGGLVKLWLASAWLALGAVSCAVLAIFLVIITGPELRALPTRLAQRLGPLGLPTLRKLLVPASLSFLSATCIAIGSALWFDSLSLGTRQVGSLTADYLLTTVVSALVVVAPAGLGAREAILTSWLSGTIEKSVIATVLLTTRLLDLTADIVFTLIGGFTLAKIWRDRKPLGT